MYGVTQVCFASSYAAALGLELWRQFRPRRVWYWLALAFGAAGLFAQSLYLAGNWPIGWMILLAWVLAVFYLYGSIHYRKWAWGVFVLPLVLGLLGLSALSAYFGNRVDPLVPAQANDPFWVTTHIGLLLLAAVGVCVGFLASVMYLIQAARLRAKTPPRQGLRLLSLERLEEMNRRAIDLAFPLLTAGLVIGLFLMLQKPLPGLFDLRIAGAVVLWLAFLVLLVLRYAWNLRGRAVAVLTIAAFVLLLLSLVLPHPTGGPS